MKHTEKLLERLLEGETEAERLRPAVILSRVLLMTYGEVVAEQSKH